MSTAIQIFLSYARADQAQVETVYQRLLAEGYTPWMDKENLFGGERWEKAIFRALEQADFVLICLTPRAYNRRGFLRREIRKALYFAKEKLDTDIYLIPVRFEECEVEESLRKYQWVDLFSVDGWDRLLKAIREGIERRQLKH
ncbi:MAG: toll/interleukin-1 receptor domain-containing protein [Acidobacteria bacterium]|nr:toll/interleukin-1 receptor domain-containing protein [Acidobacteriota bacterium]MBI3426229.1 toll/interleukin-1 receptor domain-containing protein [Acidobacteriota bacterium]